MLRDSLYVKAFKSRSYLRRLDYCAIKGTHSHKIGSRFMRQRTLLLRTDIAYTLE